METGLFAIVCDLRSFAIIWKPALNEREEEMAEVAINLRILFHSWCRKLKERAFMEVQGSLVGYSSSQTFNKLTMSAKHSLKCFSWAAMLV